MLSPLLQRTKLGESPGQYSPGENDTAPTVQWRKWPEDNSFMGEGFFLLVFSVVVQGPSRVPLERMAWQTEASLHLLKTLQGYARRGIDSVRGLARLRSSDLITLIPMFTRDYSCGSGLLIVMRLRQESGAPRKAMFAVEYGQYTPQHEIPTRSLHHGSHPCLSRFESKRTKF